MKNEHQIPVKNFIPDEGFIYRYQKLVKEVMIPFQYRVLNDEVEGVEKSHVVENFKNAALALQGKKPGDGFYGMVFQDSDAYKWLEAVAYSLTILPDPSLEKTADELIDVIAAAQDEDGYLNTYYTIKDRDRRWTNLLEGHELYCAGHMIEAGVAYYEATGKKAFLEVCIRNMEHIYRTFVTKKKQGFPGHPEVELALMKLYRVTGNEHALKLARHFLEVRGEDPQFFAKEAKKRGWQVWGMNPQDTAYNQSNVRPKELTEATGHAVRAVYLYTAMADLAGETDDEELMAACERLWENVTTRKMYVTGGIGSTGIGEAFTVNYDLPNDTAYAETCASCGLMFWAARMLEHRVDRNYADVMELTFYNTVLAGMQLDGKRYFYVNPLEVLPGISGKAVTHLHDLPERPGWYACACCPPNVARTISSFGQYAYAASGDTGYCHLYAAGRVDFGNGLKVKCNTKYPYGFTVVYEVTEGRGNLAIRIPGWCDSYRLQLEHNGENLREVRPTLVDGYAYFKDVREGDGIILTMDDKPFFLYPSTRIPENSGMVALQRGPLVYCFEGRDNEEDILSLSVHTDAAIVASPYDAGLLAGTVVLHVKAQREEASDDSLYSKKTPQYRPCMAHAVPYYTWGNRGLNEMRVWMPRR